MASKLSNIISNTTSDICKIPSLSLITNRRTQISEQSCHLSEAFSDNAVVAVFEKRNVDLFCMVSQITTSTSETFSVHFLDCKSKQYIHKRKVTGVFQETILIMD